MTQAPATPELVERVKEASYGAAQSYLNSTPWRGALRGDAFLAGVAWVISDPGFAALEAQQARIAELEAVLTLARDFAETEVEMRGAAGSDMSDYQNEAQEVVDAIDQALSSQGRREGGEG